MKGGRRLTGHCAATLGAGAASLDAMLHVADTLAISGTILADVGTFRTEMLVMRRAYDHDMSRGAAGLRAGEHKLDMGGLCVFAT